LCAAFSFLSNIYAVFFWAFNIVKMFKEKTTNKAEFNAIVVVRPISRIDLSARSSMADYALLVKGGVRA